MDEQSISNVILFKSSNRFKQYVTFNFACMELHQCFLKISSTADTGTPANNAYCTLLNMSSRQHSLGSYNQRDVRHSSSDEFPPFSRRSVFELAS
jgi:hypothetical protein